MQTIIEQAQAVNFDLLSVLAGLGLFLFGIKAMGDQLKNIAGDKMKDLIDKYTTNPIKGVLVGAIVTTLIQSSSATTALTITLVRSGLMNLGQAIGIIMGANIGTTITAILIGFNISVIAPYFIVIGAFIFMFAKKPKMGHISQLIIAFGCMFFGLELMGSSLKVLADMPIFADFAAALSHNKLAGVMVGVVMTMIIQSSSATIGIIQTLYGEGVISLVAALPILFGDNIGTTITAVLAAIGGTKEAKRAAAAHIIFNITGTIIFLLAFNLFHSFVLWGTSVFGLNNMMQIAFAHMTFNLLTTLLLFPFIKQLEKLVTLIIRDKPGEESDQLTTVLEKGLIAEAPQVALAAAGKALIDMANYTRKMHDNTRSFIADKNYGCFDKVIGYEEIVNRLNKEISQYLVEISEHTLTESNSILLNGMLYTVRDLERIGDHIVNINNHFKTIHDANEKLSEKGKEEIFEIIELVSDILNNVTTILEYPTIETCAIITTQEDKLDQLDYDARAHFIERFKSKEPMGVNKIALYVDILSDFERIGDYSQNISRRTEDLLKF